MELPGASDAVSLALGERLCRPVLAEGACLPLRAAAGLIAAAGPDTSVLFLPGLGCASDCAAHKKLSLLLGLLREHGWPVFSAERGASSAPPDALARALNLSGSRVDAAWKSAVRAGALGDMELAAESAPLRRPGIAVMGHPALVHDPGLNGNLLRALKVRGFSPVTGVNVPGRPMPDGVCGAVFLKPGGCKSGRRDAAYTAARLGALPFLTLTLAGPPAFGQNAARLAAFLDRAEPGPTP